MPCNVNNKNAKKVETDTYPTQPNVPTVQNDFNYISLISFYFDLLLIGLGLVLFAILIKK
jgi:hypothetical protein